jgi:hypothetical protein
MRSLRVDESFQHRGYMLYCSPAPMADGGYRPYVVVSRVSDGEIIANRFFPEASRCVADADAIAHGRDWAVQWIDASQIVV